MKGTVEESEELEQISDPSSRTRTGLHLPCCESEKKRLTQINKKLRFKIAYNKQIKNILMSELMVKF